MLTDLFIKNFAIIDNLHVSFREGLNVLTGETGAGKSIIIDAVNLVLGGRASMDIIRTGEEEAVVEALFDLSGHDGIVAELKESGTECDGELLVKRTISCSGRNRVFIGGGLSTLSSLTDISRRLINIYGQHESQTLLKQDNHLVLLDGYASLGPLRERFSSLYDSYRRLSSEIRRIDEGEREAARRMDLLAFQSGEISSAAISPGEEEEIEQERQLLANAEKLHNVSLAAFEALYGGDANILGSLRVVLTGIKEISAIDPSLKEPTELLNGAFLQLEESALALRDYSARIDADPQRLSSLDDRLDLIHRMKKKYGATIEEVLAYKEEINRELEALRNREETRSGLESELKRLEGEIAELGKELSVKRQKGAKALKSAMEKELHELAMRHAHFDVVLERLNEPREYGLERAEFLFSPNPGESPKPLARIASGGELSRLMLALKQVHPESDVPTLVFDEVDSGIGGATSSLVGEKLKRVAAGQQVLCITHLPQMAAFADHHLKVEKLVETGRTRTVVSPLTGEERVREMARMLGGVKITDKTMDHAREMIEQAQA
jgi:DNA repair protein RecN (Recombination protein N)